MNCLLEAGAKEKPPEALPRPMGDSSNSKHPLHTPSLRSFQHSKEKPHCKTVARTFRPFGQSEARVETLDRNGYPTIRISTVEWPGLSHKLDLRPSDVRCVINGLHLALGEL